MRTPAVRWLAVLFVVGGAAVAAEVFSDYSNASGGYSSEGDHNHIAKPFVPQLSALAQRLEVKAQGITGLGQGLMAMELREDNGGVPGALLASGTADAGLTSSGGVFVTLDPTDAFLDAGARYWAVLYGQGSDDIFWLAGANQTENLMESYDAGGGWAPVNTKRLSLRVHGVFLGAPMAVDDTYFAVEGSAQKTYSPSVKANDTAPAGVGVLLNRQIDFATASLLSDGRFFLYVQNPATGAEDVDFYGEKSFQYVLDAGQGLISEPATVRVLIAPVNDRPFFVRGADIFIAEDSATYDEPWATNIDAGPYEGDQGVWFETLDAGNPLLFEQLPTLSPAGHLSFRTRLNQTGVAQVAVRLRDDGGTALDGGDVSAVQTFVITVTQVNDPPSFNAGTYILAVNDQGPTTYPFATDISPGIGDPQQGLTFFATTADPWVFESGPTVNSSGQLQFDPAPDAGGFVNVFVYLEDDGAGTSGGPLRSPTHAFSVEFRDPPPPPDAGREIILPSGHEPEDLRTPKKRGHYACASAPGADIAALMLPLLVWTMSRRRVDRRRRTTHPT